MHALALLLLAFLNGTLLAVAILLAVEQQWLPAVMAFVAVMGITYSITHTEWEQG